MPKLRYDDWGHEYGEGDQLENRETDEVMQLLTEVQRQQLRALVEANIYRDRISDLTDEISKVRERLDLDAKKDEALETLIRTGGDRIVHLLSKDTSEGREARKFAAQIAAEMGYNESEIDLYSGVSGDGSTFTLNLEYPERP